MFLISDCDKTLVHYDNKDNNNTKDDIITLPSSSTGKVGHVHRKTLSLLDEISNNDNIEAIICCSGMRTSTMLQRKSFFPSISFWITENGGRIHEVKRNKDDNENYVEEIMEWRNYLLSDNDNLQKLIQLQSDLITSGWDVDGIETKNTCTDINNTNYLTMIRVKSSKETNLETILPLISPTLKWSFNLGYLDVYLPNSGKLKSSQWLMKHIRKKRKEFDINDSYTYYFLGDDDNDIEIASDSTKAFIVEPCSESMKQFIYENMDTNRLVISNKTYHEATINLLQIIHSLLQ